MMPVSGLTAALGAPGLVPGLALLAAPICHALLHTAPAAIAVPATSAQHLAGLALTQKTDTSHARVSAPQCGIVLPRPAQLHEPPPLSPALLKDVMHCARQKQTGVSMTQILGFCGQGVAKQLLVSARFLHHELPIRLAHRIVELNSLPPALSNNIHLQRVKRWYSDSFTDIRDFPAIHTAGDVEAFTDMLGRAYARHTAVVPAIAKGVEEFKRTMALEGVREEELSMDLHSFLDRFFMSRIALRFLAGNHVSLHEQAHDPDARRPDRIGLIHTQCRPVQVVRDAVEDARDVCMRVRGDCPEVTIIGSESLSFPYVPSHLHHMVFEVTKNSLRAVAERYDGADASPPDVKVIVATGREDITIKISDQGGGIPRSGVKRLFTYLYTTAKSPLPDVDPADDTYQSLPSVLAGYGCGLSLSRLYARYFGGDLQLFSMQGYGTDAFLHLSRLGNAAEPLEQ